MLCNVSGDADNRICTAMKVETTLNAHDEAVIASGLQKFFPAEVYDIHAHPINPGHYPKGECDFLADQRAVGCVEHRAALMRYFPVKTLHGLYFGMPQKNANRSAVNGWIAEEVRSHGTSLSRALMLVSPEDDPVCVADELRSGRFCGLKVYHCYAKGADTSQAQIEEYAPDWMWELVHEIRGVLMLHIMRDRAIDDPGNQRSLRRLCGAYPQARVILAHVARSFNYRNARRGLHAIANLANAVVDTSAIGEADSFRTALSVLGPKRVLWGSDFVVSEFRGRCVTTGAHFYWLHPQGLLSENLKATRSTMTLVGIESLLCLREACEDAGLVPADLEDIFLRNALRTLEPHLGSEALRPRKQPAAEGARN